MKTNAYEYLHEIFMRKYFGNFMTIELTVTLNRLLRSKKEKIKVINKDGHLVQVVDNLHEYEIKKRKRMGWSCKN